MTEPEPPPQEHAGDLSVSHFLALFGGWKGLFDSTVPALVFIVVKLLSDLNTAIVAALVVGVLIVAVRRVRGESLQYSASGFVGLVVAVLIARATGSGKGFFLPGILLTAFSGLGFLISILVRRPAIALVLVAIDPKYDVWKDNAALRRACVKATWVWTASFFIRATVASVVALTVGDNAKDNAILFGVIQAEKYLLLAGAALYTVVAVRRVPVAPRPAPDPAADLEPEPDLN
ncbi:MAG: hypothetical protein QOJ92_2640 [Frankiales bacterium]|nr:hypothetical protein [Frankiales bacterium]